MRTIGVLVHMEELSEAPGHVCERLMQTKPSDAILISNRLAFCLAGIAKRRSARRTFFGRTISRSPHGKLRVPRVPILAFFTRSVTQFLR